MKRIQVKRVRVHTTMDFSFDGFMEIDEFCDEVKKRYQEILSFIKPYSPDGEIKLAYAYGEWDNPDEIQVVETYYSLESNEEFNKRKRKTARDNAKKQKELENARKLLEKEGYNITQNEGE